MQEWINSLRQQQGKSSYVSDDLIVSLAQASGKGNPPAFPPLDGSKVATGAKEGHIDIVMNGKPGTAMAAFKQQLNDTDVAAVITYERTSWSNKAGMVQPAEVKARRK